MPFSDNNENSDISLLGLSFKILIFEYELLKYIHSLYDSQQ